MLLCVNNYDFEKINILEYALGGRGVIKKCTLCTLLQMSIIVNDP